MGVDLTVVPEWMPGLSLAPLAVTRFDMDIRDYDLWKALKEASTPLECGLQWYGDDGIETRTTDAYGDPIGFVTAFTFLRLWREHLDGDRSRWDRAVIAFIQELEPERRVLLYFH